MNTIEDCQNAWKNTFPFFVKDCRQVLSSELHYQAMVYYSLRTHGNISLNQIGMNVKMCIRNPQTSYFRKISENRSEGYDGLCEPIPDLVVFKSRINGDWRRRNCLYNSVIESPHMQILMEMEIKASERSEGRLTYAEIENDMQKLNAHKEEIMLARLDAKIKSENYYQVMLVIDTAPIEEEQMTRRSINLCKSFAIENSIHFCYVGRNEEIF